MVAVFLKDLRLLLRDPSALVLSLLAPVAMIAIITLGRDQNTDSSRPLMPIVDNDEGPVAGAFIELLGRHANVALMNEADAEHLVRDLNRAPAAIIFPEGLSKRYLQGQASTITMLTDPAQGIALGNIRALLLVMDRDAAELADPLHEDLLVYQDRNVTGREGSAGSREQNVPGFALMFVLLAVVFGTSSAMHDERGWGTLPRLLVAPARFTQLLVGKLGVRFVLGFVQLLGLLLFGRLVFGISLGSSVPALVLLGAATAFSTAALGLALGAVAATREQTLPLSLATTLGLSGLGGLWWPLSLVPAWLRVLGQLFFPTWAMYGLTDLILRDRGFGAALFPIGVMMFEGAALLAVGLWIFRMRYMPR
jgi:ABC-type multidrug transport system permease subunit